MRLRRGLPDTFDVRHEVSRGLDLAALDSVNGRAMYMGRNPIVGTRGKGTGAADYPDSGRDAAGYGHTRRGDETAAALALIVVRKRERNDDRAYPPDFAVWHGNAGGGGFYRDTFIRMLACHPDRMQVNR